MATTAHDTGALTDEENDMEERAINKLCALISSNKVIPVIGFDLYNYDFEGKGKLVNIQSELARRFNPDLAANLLTKSPDIPDFDLFNAIYHKCDDGDKDSFG